MGVCFEWRPLEARVFWQVCMIADGGNSRQLMEWLLGHEVG